MKTIIYAIRTFIGTPLLILAILILPRQVSAYLILGIYENGKDRLKSLKEENDRILKEL